MTNRYNRQELLWGTKGQEKLGNSTIAIIGEDPFCFPAALNAALIGVHSRLLVTGQSGKGEHALDFVLTGENLANEYQRIFSQINPLGRVSQLTVSLDSAVDNCWLEGANAIIDLTNNPSSKEKGLEFALKHKIPFISSYSVNGYVVIEGGKNSPVYQEYRGRPKDLFLCWPTGGFVVDRVVNAIMSKASSVDGSHFFKPGYSYPFEALREGEQPRPMNTNYFDGKTALVAGVGGQGCFAVPILSQFGFQKIFYMDGKSVQDHNLSRQPLYWDSIGLSKAEVCSAKHNKIAGREVAYPIIQRFDEHFDSSEPIDIIYGFTDTFTSRFIMSQYASRKRIPFIGAASDPASAEWCFYVPGETICYMHLYEKMIPSIIAHEHEIMIGCAENPNPQVVMPNCLAGSLAVILSAYDIKFNGKLLYRSGQTQAFGSLSEPDACRCHIDGPIELRM